MADERGLKRARANTAGQNFEQPPPFAVISCALQALPHNLVSHILMGVALSDPGVAAIILQQHGRIIEEERVKVINFDPYSKTVWHAMNVRHESLTTSNQYDMAGDVEDTITETIEAIKTNVQQSSSFGTKRSAVETLRKIGKTICVSVGVIPSEVRKGYCALDVAMCDILQLMSPEERAIMSTINDGRGQFIGKMEELSALCESYCIFDQMSDAVALLGGGESDDDESGSDNENDSDENDEEEETGDDKKD